MVSIFYRYPRLTILTLFLVVAAGLGSLATLGRQEDPSLIERFGTVVTYFPGASAERVEALITEPLEASIMELAEMDEVISTTRAGVSVINVAFREDLSESEVEQTWTKLSEQVTSVRPLLPENASAPKINRQYMGAATIVIGVSWASEGEPNLAIMTRLARDLEDRLQNMSGTEETEIFGEAQEEIRVEVDPEALAALGLTARDVADILADSDAKVPAGAITGRHIDLSVEVAGELDSLQRVRAVPIAQTPDGRFVSVGDVATVTKGVRSPASAVALYDDQRMIFLAAYLQPELQVEEWSNRAEALVDAFNAEVDGINVEVLVAQSDYVSKRLNGLALNLLNSALIVFGVLFLMMGWRSALVVGAALPLTILLVLLLINVYGSPLHQMSVTGLVVALGLLIDNAIVVVDDYRILRRRNMSRVDAMEKAVKILFVPLLASTVTTVLAFAPIALMPGVAGEFISMIGVSVIFAVTASFVLSMTVIAAFAAWFDHDERSDTPGPFWRDGLRSKPIANAYRGLLSGILKRPSLGIVLGLLLPIAGFMAAQTLPMQFFPATDRDIFQVRLTLPATASIEETQAEVARAREFIAAREGVEHVAWVIGRSAPRTYYNVLTGDEGRPNYATGWVKTRSNADTKRILQTLQEDMRTAFPDSVFLTLPFEQGPPLVAPIALRVFGPSFDQLVETGDEIRAILATTPGVTYTEAMMERGIPVARLAADEAAAQLAGLRLTDVAGRIRSDLDGVVGGSILEGVEDIPVRVIASDARRARIGDVIATPLPGQPGVASASVGALGEFELEPKITSITRYNGERMNMVLGYLSPYVLPDPVLQDFFTRFEAAGIAVPAGYRLSISGEAEERGAAMGGLMSTALPLLILMIGSVVLAFNSFRYAGVVFITGFLSVGLAMFGVWLFGMPLGFNAIVGTMGLVGLSINGSIVVLSALKANAQARAGDFIAIRETVMDATRHIVSTTLTTMGGFVPLILEGDSFWLPFAAAVAGGVAGSALLALIMAPAAFVWLIRSEGVRLTYDEANDPHITDEDKGLSIAAQ